MSFAAAVRPGVPPGFRPGGPTFSYAMGGHSTGRGSTRPPITPLYHVPVGSTGFTPGKSPWGPSRNKTRPSNFQKWVKKFSGSGDPYDHLASFKQVARAEEVTDLHCLVEGFGLTLEGKALSWFQTLDPLAFGDFNALERDFISAFTKTGIKHSVSQLIYDFKQEEKESVRDCANRLRQYIARCPDNEKPNPEKLVSIFLEGLLNKSLHANLYMKKHTSLNDCIYDAIDLDDNCDIYGKNKPITGTMAQSTRGSIDSDKTHPADAEAIAELVMRKMNQVFKPPQRMHRCDICGGDHPRGQCLLKQDQPMQRAPRTDKWCNFCQLWTNHETQECYHRIRFMREQGMAQAPAAAPQQPQYAPRVGNPNYRNQNYGNPNYAAPGAERAQPVLGNQPLYLGQLQ